jgi:TrmH family RNA methyltransferase
LLTPEQRARFDVVLVSPRNPLNIGAVARAMANFGFDHLAVAAPYLPNWREAKSAVGAPHLLSNAREHATLADAVSQCTFVAGTGTLTYRKPEQPIISLPQLAPLVEQAIAAGGRAAIVFGPEKHGLTGQDLSYCNVLVEIPTDARQPSMNLGQAAAVCLYELVRPGTSAGATIPSVASESPALVETMAARADALERLGVLVEEVMLSANYSPNGMRDSNRHDLRILLRRLNLTDFDVRRIMGLFRRILHRLHGRSKTP